MKMKREYTTCYRSDSDTKIKKKEKNNYLCPDKISLSMVLNFVCVCRDTRARIDHMFTLI